MEHGEAGDGNLLSAVTLQGARTRNTSVNFRGPNPADPKTGTVHSKWFALFFFVVLDLAGSLRVYRCTRADTRRPNNTPMNPKQRKYNGYSLVYRHRRSEPFSYFAFNSGLSQDKKTKASRTTWYKSCLWMIKSLIFPKWMYKLAAVTCDNPIASLCFRLYTLTRVLFQSWRSIIVLVMSSIGRIISNRLWPQPV